MPKSVRLRVDDDFEQALARGQARANRERQAKLKSRERDPALGRRLVDGAWVNPYRHEQRPVNEQNRLTRDYANAMKITLKKHKL